MTYHVLNGDALTDRFRAAAIPGEVIVCRECLIEGDLSGETLDAFYQTRAAYLSAAYNEVQQNYFTEVASEFDRLTAAPDPSQFNLWFGYDLFCSANMWFVLSLLQALPVNKQVFIVYPSHLKGADVWLDFGGANLGQLAYCFENRIALADEDLQLAAQLWQAYQRNNLAALTQLSKQPSACFPYLKEVCQAHVDRFAEGGKGRPERVIEELLNGPEKDFAAVFQAFFKRAGIYGFGDEQVKKIYDGLLQNRQEHNL